jgi:CheY-like chemotaxis protein/HPt (histidine-containing phosphotransfer) domain-containing protein
LESWGCDVNLASAGGEALDVLRTAQARGRAFELVLLDVQMPDMDGIAVASAVAKADLYGSPKIVLLSSAGSRREVDPANASRCAAYLTKPIKQSQLMDALLEIVAPQPVSDSPQWAVPGANEAVKPDAALPLARVLLAEDNPVNRRVATGILRKLGCEVREAENGRLAIDALEHEAFDLVFMDVQMPEMDGFEATGHLRADSRWETLPIIAMTAHAMKGDRERCLAAGMSDYIAKPVSLEVIRRMIEKWVQPSSDCAPRQDRGAPRSTQGKSPLSIELALLNLGGDEELLREVLSAFIEMLPHQREELRAACTQTDAAKLGAVAHSLKGSASNICAEPVRSLAARMEELVRTGNLSDAASLLPKLEKHLGRLQECASAWLREGHSAQALPSAIRGSSKN